MTSLGSRRVFFLHTHSVHSLSEEECSKQNSPTPRTLRLQKLSVFFVSQRVPANVNLLLFVGDEETSLANCNLFADKVLLYVSCNDSQDSNSISITHNTPSFEFLSLLPSSPDLLYQYPASRRHPLQDRSAIRGTRRKRQRINLASPRDSR